MRVMGVRLSRWGILLVVVLLGSFPATSRAALSWSAPVSVNDAQPNPMWGVACPAASQCTAVDSYGMQVSFDPGSPEAWSSYVVEAPQEDWTVTCPALSQCTAVGAGGREVTFDPDVFGSSTSHVIDGGRLLEAIACPSVSQCTAVDEDGRVLTFDPLNPAAAVAVSLSSTVLSAIACPTVSQCTAIDSGTSSYEPVGAPRLITFDPHAPNTSHTVQVAGLGGSLACPSVSECVAIAGTQGQTVTFDAISGQAQPAITRSQNPLSNLACPAASQCTAMDDLGYEVTFNPSSAGDLTQARVDVVGGCCTDNALGRIACPTTTRCVVVAQTYGSAEWTFDPRAPSGLESVAVADGAPNIALACPVARECVALAKVTASFLPAPALTSSTATFDPDSHLNPTASSRTLREPAGLACPTATQCTLVTDHSKYGACGHCTKPAWGREVTFDPRRSSQRARFTAGKPIDRASLTGIACPTFTECAAIDTRGREVTFNPRHPGRPRLAKLADRALDGIDCPSRVLCVAVGRGAEEVAFDPRDPHTPTRLKLGGAGAITGISCPSTHECVAVDARGYEVTSNPKGRSVPTNHIDTHHLTAISCPTHTFCVAVDGAGRTIEGNPRRERPWTVHRLPGASPLQAVACSSRRLCVAVDADGHVFTGRA